jgi:hypothetical protein
MSWMRISMSHIEANSGKSEMIKRQYEAALIDCGSPEGAELFSNSPLERQFVFYFSPKAADVFRSHLASLEAETCETPARTGLISEVVVGRAFDCFG